MSDRKAVIKNADMGEEMQQDAVDCATQALEKYNIEKVRKLLFLFSRNVSWYWDLHSWLRQSIDLTHSSELATYLQQPQNFSFSFSFLFSGGKIINISDLL